MAIRFEKLYGWLRRASRWDISITVLYGSPVNSQTYNFLNPQLSLIEDAKVHDYGSDAVDQRCLLIARSQLSVNVLLIVASRFGIIIILISGL